MLHSQINKTIAVWINALMTVASMHPVKSVPFSNSSYDVAYKLCHILLQSLSVAAVSEVPYECECDSQFAVQNLINHH
jgi:hypothetical protein